MKAKRLTALALAALMAVSTTSVALATGERVDYDLDVVTSPVQYYKYDSDAGMLVKVDNNDFQPGDDVYILLDETGTKLTSTKTYNAYATWTIGDSWVKDIDLVYRKGAIASTGASTTEYSLSVSDPLLSSFDKYKIAGATSKEDALAKVQSYIASNRQQKVDEIAKEYYVTAWEYNNNLYRYESQAIEAAEKDSNNIKKVNPYYMVDGTKPVMDTSGYTSASSGYIYTEDGKKCYVADLPTALAKAGYTEYTSGFGTTYYLAEGSSVSPDGYGNIVDKNEEGSLTALPESKAGGSGIQIWVNTTTNKYITAAIAKNNVPTATNNFITLPVADEYYDSSNYVHTLTTVEEAAYFYNDGTFYKKASEVESAPSTFAAKPITKVEEASLVDGDLSRGYTAAKTKAGERFDAATAALNTGNIVETTIPGATTTVPQHEYWIKITTKDSTTTKDIDVVGKVSVGTSKSSAGKDQEVSVDFTLTNSDPGNNSYVDADSDVYIEPGERAVVSFADDASDEFTVEFGDDAYFVFNARGQGKLNLAYNTKYNKDFAYDYDDANIDFINFEGEPTTNRTGTLYIYADEDSYIYEVTSKGAKKINGAYYDDDEEAWVIRTRSLTSYAISDKKLKTVDQMNNGSSSSSGSNSGSNSGSGSNNGKPNPDTGR